MSLIRWNPERELTPFPSDIVNIQRGINRMFDSFFSGTGWDEEIGTSVWSPAVDIAENENEYVVKMELPGLGKDDVKITTQENILTVRGEKKKEKEAKGSSFHRIERSYGEFQRSFTLPGTIKHEEIAATFKDGILTITMPKEELAKAKAIEVKVR